MEGSNVQKFTEMSFNVDDEFMNKLDDQDNGNDHEYCQPQDGDNIDDETYSEKEAAYRELRKSKRRTQGLSISDIPNNVFNQDQYLVHENSGSQKSNSNDEYKETINFGQMSDEKIKKFDERRSLSPKKIIIPDELDDYEQFISDPYYDNNKFYGIDYTENEKELVVSPIKYAKENSADKAEGFILNKRASCAELDVKSSKFDSPEQKFNFEELKMKTINIKAAMNNYEDIPESPFSNNLTGRSHPVGNNIPNNMKIQTLKFPGFRSKSRISELESNTNRETYKSESSWIPTFSKFEYDEDNHGGKEVLDNILLSTDRISYFKHVQHPPNTKEAIKDFIDTDPLKISATLESHRSMLESISQAANNLREKYESQEEFHRKCVGNKIDMERIGSIIDEKLNKLFREQELSANHLSELKKSIQLKEEE